jgi:hypothetical protein
MVNQGRRVLRGGPVSKARTAKCRGADQADQFRGVDLRKKMKNVSLALRKKDDCTIECGNDDVNPRMIGRLTITIVKRANSVDLTKVLLRRRLPGELHGVACASSAKRCGSPAAGLRIEWLCWSTCSMIPWFTHIW